VATVRVLKSLVETLSIKDKVLYEIEVKDIDSDLTMIYNLPIERISEDAYDDCEVCIVDKDLLTEAINNTLKEELKCLNG